MPQVLQASKVDLRTKELLFEPFDKQQRFLECVYSGDYRFILYGGSVRSGKTFSGLAALIMLSIRYPTSRWVVVRKDLQTIKRNTLPSWEKIKPREFIVSHNMDTQTVTFENGSQIIFFGENYDKDKDFNRWRGLETNGFLLEEINELQEQAYFKAIERAGSYVLKDGAQPPPLIMATCNPTHGWVKDRFYKPWQNGTLPENQIYIPANINDNPYIPDDYRESLKSLPRYEYEVYVLGNWDIQLKTGGEFLKDFELEKHVRPVTFDPLKPLHISLDENVQPYITLTLWQIEGKEIRQVGEILGRAPNNTVKKLVRNLISWCHSKGFADLVYIYGDRTSLKEDTKLEKGQNFFTIFQRELESDFHSRMRLPRINPSVALSGNFVNAIFETEFDDLKITIGEHCKESINDYILTKEAADGTILKVRVRDSVTKLTYEENGHITDSFRYFVCEAFKDSFRKYQSKSYLTKDYVIGKSSKGKGRSR